MNQQQISLLNDGIALADVESLYTDIPMYVISLTYHLKLLSGPKCVLS